MDEPGALVVDEGHGVDSEPAPPTTPPNATYTNGHYRSKAMQDNESRTTTTHSNHSGSSNNSSRDELVTETAVDQDTVEVTVDTSLMAQANAAAAAAAKLATNKGSVANALGRGRLLATTKTKNRVLMDKPKSGRPKLSTSPVVTPSTTGPVATVKKSPKKKPVKKNKPTSKKSLAAPSCSPQRASSRRTNTVRYMDDSDDEAAFNQFLENPASPVVEEEAEAELNQFIDEAPRIQTTSIEPSPQKPAKRKGRTPKAKTPVKQPKIEHDIYEEEQVDEMVQIPRAEFDRLRGIEKTYMKIKKLMQ